MKVILFLILLVIGLIAFQTKAYDVVLKFPSKVEADRWYIWFLDGGGEDSSGLIATDWSEDENFAFIKLDGQGKTDEGTTKTLDRHRSKIRRSK